MKACKHGECGFFVDGECRYNPPVPVYLRKLDNYVSVYPEVDADDPACARFFRRGIDEAHIPAGRGGVKR